MLVLCDCSEILILTAIITRILCSDIKLVDPHPALFFVFFFGLIYLFLISFKCNPFQMQYLVIVLTEVLVLVIWCTYIAWTCSISYHKTCLLWLFLHVELWTYCVFYLNRVLVMSACSMTDLNISILFQEKVQWFICAWVTLYPVLVIASLQYSDCASVFFVDNFIMMITVVHLRGIFLNPLWIKLVLVTVHPQCPVWLWNACSCIHCLLWYKAYLSHLTDDSVISLYDWCIYIFINGFVSFKD